MKTYLFTSPSFNGSMRFGYNNGVLELFENNAELDEKQIDFFEHNFPFRLEHLELIKGKGTMQEITDLSFDAIWEKYAYKVDKINAETYWNKMSNEDKLAAICGIGKYNYRLKLKNVAKIYLVRYLKYRRWEDEQ